LPILVSHSLLDIYILQLNKDHIISNKASRDSAKDQSWFLIRCFNWY